MERLQITKNKILNKNNSIFHPKSINDSTYIYNKNMNNSALVKENNINVLNFPFEENDSVQYKEKENSGTKIKDNENIRAIQIIKNLSTKSISDFTDDEIKCLHSIKNNNLFKTKFSKVIRAQRSLYNRVQVHYMK